MKYDYRRLPAALKELGTYGLFRKKGLAPVSAAEFLIGNRVFFEVNNPRTWSDFDEALRAYETDTTGEIRGIACVLLEHHNIVCFDFDKPKPAEEYARRPLGNLSYADYVEAHMADVQDMIGDLSRGTFVERSRSGQGYHAFFNGAIPAALGGYNGRFIYGDVFSRNQAIFLTADYPAHWPTRLAGQAGVDHVLKNIEKTLEIFAGQDQWNGTAAEVSTEYGRLTDKSDAEILALYFGRNKEHQEIYNGTIKNYANGEQNWSTGTNLLQKELDKITGDPEQIYRLMFNSPRLLNAGKAGNGVDRMRRTDKFFDRYLATARVKNNDWFSKNGGNHYANRAFAIEHGKQLFAAMSSGFAPASAPAPVATPAASTGTLDERLLAAGANEEINEEGEPYWTIGSGDNRQFIGKTPAALEAWLAARAPVTQAPPPVAQFTPQPEQPTQPPRQVSSVAKAGRFTPLAIQALQSLMGNDLPSEYMKFHEPPGLLGEACRMAAKGMYEPLPYLAVPATIVAMSGIVSQAYKYHGSGLNVMFVAGAKTGVGKTQAADVWNDFIEEIIASDENLANVKNRVAPFNVGSKVGAHTLLQRRSCFAWFNDECEHLLDMLENRKDPAAISVQQIVLKMFEISKDTAKWEPDESRTGKNMHDRVLRNVSIASFWATTIATLRQYLQPEFLSKGFGSRLLFLLYKGVSGVEQQPRNILRQLPEGDLRRTLKTLLKTAQEVESMYQAFPAWYRDLKAEEKKDYEIPAQQMNYQALVHVTESPEAEEFLSAMRARIGVFKRNVQAEESSYPEYYTMLSRIGMIAPRIAGIMAVLENPNKPVMTLPQVYYAFGYCLQIMGETISAFDTNELGASLSTADMVAVDVIRKLIRKTPAFAIDGVPSWAFMRMLKMRAPFHNSKDSQLADKTLRALIDHNLVDVVKDMGGEGQRGPKKTLIKITNATEWEELYTK
jgi:hypothetical protein